MTVEFKKYFEQIDTEEFRAEYESVKWFCKCIFAANSMYASFLVSVFQKLYSRKKGMQIDAEGIDRMLPMLPEGEEGFGFSSKKAVQEFAFLVTELSNNTRMVSNCGFKPNEMSHRRGNTSMRIVSKNTQKIYPNSPCPCGSGKKYKKCCGRKSTSS